MNKRLTNLLLKKYPNLYKQYYLSAQETCMCWGFDCGNGWYKLLKTLSDNLKLVSPECEAVQVKEKFGGLRFYVVNVTDNGYNLIHAAEKLSYTICEECGKKGKLIIKKGWYKTLCPKCQNKSQ